MQALIMLKNEKSIRVLNLSKVVAHKGIHSDRREFKKEDLNDFRIGNVAYSFIGDNIVAVEGSDILYVDFDVTED
ncbi:hypothetical protein D0504_02255 [Weissella confusa]|uniref:hypothetical protein n=1 Tax=Weissella confusa TaxID=1583 RepID=UPI0002465C57|nr:hypothetical protein [Weissella confusa]MBJ7616566.1 hypothetical protein [Weissella confusa]MBJ7627305.1 hypothetical protein [Weissella confusa]MCT8392560.1 hypothetical protein [Weissella confusa]CCF29783.1 Protein of unknown function [Weissella confusa LBAE C39-2]